MRSVLVGLRTLDESFDKKVALDVRDRGEIINKSSPSGSCGNMWVEGADLLFAEIVQNINYHRIHYLRTHTAECRVAQ